MLELVTRKSIFPFRYPNVPSTQIRYDVLDDIYDTDNNNKGGFPRISAQRELYCPGDAEMESFWRSQKSSGGRTSAAVASLPEGDHDDDSAKHYYEQGTKRKKAVTSSSQESDAPSTPHMGRGRQPARPGQKQHSNKHTSSAFAASREFLANNNNNKNNNNKMRVNAAQKPKDDSQHVATKNKLLCQFPSAAAAASSGATSANYTPSKEVKKSRGKQVQQNSHKNVKSRRSNDLGSGDVDLELDDLLFKLEDDDEFQKLSDNEKLTWLESLFYQDTRHLSSGSAFRPQMRSVPKAEAASSAAKRNNQLAINKPASRADEDENVKPSSTAFKANEVKDPVNAKMVGVAQSFFGVGAGGGKQTAVKKKSVGAAPQQLNNSMSGNNLDNNNREGTKSVENGKTPSWEFPKGPSTSSTPSSGLISNGKAKPKPPRPSFSKKQPSPSPSPPPIPPRSTQTKTTMLRLMNTATSILKNDRKN